VKLLFKFNLILGLVFAVGLAVFAYVSRSFLEGNARDEVVRQASLMMEAMSAARDYTTIEVKPLLEKVQEHDKSFLPETVPAFAATECFNFLRHRYPDYAYKEAALNPTNLRDRAVDWEADVINNFRNHPGIHELTGQRNSVNGPSLFFARSIAAAPPCLLCHSTASVAPAAMINTYGRDNGFGWKPNEIVAAQIVSVPMAVPEAMAHRAFTTLVSYLAVVFAGSLLLLDLVLLVTVVRPLRKLSAMADQISTGQMDIPELPVSGKDEIAVLAGSFNRMRRSLEKALKLLDN
jgi:HAMP domain-containing protein